VCFLVVVVVCVFGRTRRFASIEHLDPWISYHRSVGVDFFFLFAEEQAASAHSHATLGTFHVMFFCASLSLDPPHPTSLSLSVP
jgi:hypothetical protein